MHAGKLARLVPGEWAVIHGFGGDLQNWQFNQPDLAANRKVYAIDLPGHGASSKALNGADVPALAAPDAGEVLQGGCAAARD